MPEAIVFSAASFLLAGLLDLALGDPRVPWHPVRLIGRLMELCEKLSRRLLPPRVAGIASWLVVVGLVGGIGLNASGWSWRLGSWLGIPVDAILLWVAIAPRDLASHAWRIWRPLAHGGIQLARLNLSWIVGRQTKSLDQAGVVRASVESLAESSVDGVIAPLFWAMLLGPVAALVYRAINTLDSQCGHKTPRYFEFGWLSARADDVANWLPARICILAIFPAAVLLGQDYKSAWAVFTRDRLKHDSPNAAHAEAAFAGALGLRLGGNSLYPEGVIDKPYLGDPRQPAEPDKIKQAIVLMLVSAVFAMVYAISIRTVILVICAG